MLAQMSEMESVNDKPSDEQYLQIEDEQEEFMTPMQELWTSYLQYGEEGPQEAYYIYDEGQDSIKIRDNFLV